MTVEQRNEQSNNPAIRISGRYTGVQLQLATNYLEGRDKAKAYSLDVMAIGDSIQLSLSGSGTAGAYHQLDLGTYAVAYQPVGSSNGGYFTVKKDIRKDYNAVSVIDRILGGTSGRQVVYSLPISLYQFVAGNPKAGQLTPVKASDIFSSSQRLAGIFTFERVVTVVN